MKLSRVCSGDWRLTDGRNEPRPTSTWSYKCCWKMISAVTKATTYLTATSVITGRHIRQTISFSSSLAFSVIWSRRYDCFFLIDVCCVVLFVISLLQASFHLTFGCLLLFPRMSTFLSLCPLSSSSHGRIITSASSSHLLVVILLVLSLLPRSVRHTTELF